MSKANKLWPGKPNYRGPKEGFFTFLHHNQPIEFSGNVMERIKYIKSKKPPNEVTTRLSAIRYLPGGLPAFCPYHHYVTSLITPQQSRFVHKELKKVIPKVRWRIGRHGGLVFPK